MPQFHRLSTLPFSFLTLPDDLKRIGRCQYLPVGRKGQDNPWALELLTTHARENEGREYGEETKENSDGGKSLHTRSLPHGFITFVPAAMPMPLQTLAQVFLPLYLRR
jgi:hypothetical protein